MCWACCRATRIDASNPNSQEHGASSPGYYAVFMSHAIPAAAAAVRPATPEDAAGIARIFLESAEYHFRLDPERYFVPDFGVVAVQYLSPDRRYDSPGGEVVTFVADLGGEIVGFVDVALYRPTDAMHRDITYCHIFEIAVSSRAAARASVRGCFGPRRRGDA